MASPSLRFSLAIALLLAWVGGCVPSFDPASKITKSRVLGVRVEAATDATRAWPRPGENANVRILVVHPGPDPVHLFWQLRGCALLPTPTGAATCLGPSFPIPSASGDEAAAPPSYEIAFSAAVPPLPPNLGVDRLLIFGAVCVGGAATAGDTPDASHCAQGATDTTRFVYRVALAVDPAAGTNQNPSIADDAVTLAGAPWPPAPANLDEATACSGDVLPSVSMPDAVTVGVHFDAAARETYDVPSTDPPTTAREVFQLSHFATAGSLDQQFSIYDAAATDRTVKWTPPKQGAAPADGLVRFWLVVRDGRGGTAWTERDLCAR